MVGLLNGRYQIHQALNEGGFGKTFLAEDVQMPSRRFCVIKQLKPIQNNERIQKIVLDRFQREAVILERIGQGHPQIPDLFAYFEEAGEFYLVQEWIEGQTLEEIVKIHGFLNEADVIKLLYQILDVLDYIHSRNIIHRDIKPDNIIVRDKDQQPCLIDFGAVKEVMATQVNAQGQPSRSIVIGTLGFMPREQAAGRPTFASDLYSLGLTAIYLLTGQFPEQFETDSTSGRLQWRQTCSTLSPQFANLLDQVIKPHPKHRFVTVTAMRTALQSVANPHTSTVLSKPPKKDNLIAKVGLSNGRSFRPSKGQLRWVALAASGAAIATAGLFFLFRPQLHYFWGEQAAGRGDWPEAIGQFEQALELKTDYPDASLKLGESYAEIGKYFEAISQFDTLIDQKSEMVAAYRQRGEVRFEIGEYQAAIADYDQAINIDPKNAEAYNVRGDAKTEIGQYEDAIADYRQAIRLRSNYALAYTNLSSIFFTQGDLKTAIQHLDQAIAADPTAVSAYVNRGSRRSELGDEEGAKQDWNKVLELPVVSAQDYVRRGYAKSRLGLKNGAIADYNQALIINPKLARAHTNLGAALYEKGEREKAIKALDQALTINKNSTIALTIRGELWAFPANQPDWNRALEDYDRALAINPHDPFVLNNRCGAFFALNDFEKALADCTKGLEINPKSAALYTVRGNIRLQAKDLDGAIQDYGRAIKINADRNNEIRSQAAYSNRASARTQLQDLDGAISDLNQALRLKPDAAEDYYKRGVIYGTQGKREDAIADLKQAADLYAQQGRTDSYNEVLRVLQSLGEG